MQRTLKISILGTRGIPNRFGGFEQCAEKIALHAVRMGHVVTVYNPKDHYYREDAWNAIHIRRIHSNEQRYGFLNPFLFDYLSLKDAVTQENDVILELGYSPCSLFYYLKQRTTAKIVTNMAGLEWKRSKWNAVAKAIIQYSEKLAVDKSDAVVSDNLGLQQYFRETYGKETIYIPYGAELVHEPGLDYLVQFNVQPYGYYILVARFQSDNNIEMILDGYSLAHTRMPFLVIGDHQNRYGSYLKSKFKEHTGIRFMGAIYDYALLSALRWNSLLYFHGHSCGGTNPSLLEAMASNAIIAAHDNMFNRNVLGEHGFYFQNKYDVERLIRNHTDRNRNDIIAQNRDKISKTYTWESVTDAYMDLFTKLCQT